MKARASSLVPVVYVLVAAQAVLLGGCLERKLTPLNPCLVSGVVAEIAVTNIDKVDMLFMVDNSGSMKEEQASLREEFPKLIRVLTTGDRENGTDPFPPAKDLHLGVVSSDMGLVGISDIDKCAGQGDDGIMNPREGWMIGPPTDVTGCQASYPRFLSYTAGVNNQQQTANDFACIAALGTEGCGFEQQLESALKAVWPMNDPMPVNGKNRISFLGDVNGANTDGHGDNANANFLRNDPTMGLSLIAIIMVTDEEDCSSANTTHFTPMHYLDPSDPLAMQDLNLRCFYNPQNLYPLERYINGFKALRPGNENLVIFGAIVGVPPDLVEAADYQAVDWTDDAQRNNFYDRILGDNRMQEMVDPNRTPQQGQNLVPSCNTDRGRAYPPRRLVEVAKGFGPNGTIHSICQDDLGPAIDAIIEVIARQLGAVCLPRPLVRTSDGTVGCNVVWELPPPGANLGPKTPTSCGGAEFPFLLPPDAGRASTTEKGGQVCKVAQLKVEGDGMNKKQVRTTDEETGATFDDGWYYDDFSTEVGRECTGDSKQRVAFTSKAKPPTGVTVKLECLNETQSLARSRTDVDTSSQQPTIGDPCEEVRRNGQLLMGDQACEVRLAQPDASGSNIDRSMFCHPKQNVCVLSCSTNAVCPAAWVCDDRPETLADTTRPGADNGTPICINPTCGDSSK